MPRHQNRHSEIKKCGNLKFVCRVAEGSVAAVFGHDKDGFVRKELHRGLHAALLCFHAAQSLNVQTINCRDKMIGGIHLTNKVHTFYNCVACNAQIVIIKPTLNKNTVIHHTCFPSACEAAFPKAAVGLSGIAGIPKAQVTSETLQRLLFVKSH